MKTLYLVFGLNFVFKLKLRDDVLLYVGHFDSPWFCHLKTNWIKDCVTCFRLKQSFFSQFGKENQHFGDLRLSDNTDIQNLF